MPTTTNRSTSSVLMSVYHRVNLAELRQCLESLKTQSRQPDQIVIVIDGPIPSELSTYIEAFQHSKPEQVILVPQTENGGLVAALNSGLNYCSGEWILRMDADDIALPRRFEIQLGLLEANPDIDVLGSAMLEFDSDPRHPARLKPVLESHGEIVANLGLRNPINHPTACIRKTHLERVGGYPALTLLEDYFLWARLLNNGATFRNIAEPLYLFRFDDQTLERRGGASNFSNEVWLRRWMYREKLINWPTLWLTTTLQIILRFAPLAVRRFLWQRSRRRYSKPVQLPDSI